MSNEWVKACGRYILNVKKYKRGLLVPSKETGLEVNAEKTMYRIFSNLIRTQFLTISSMEKKLVCVSNPHLSFNRPLPTGRLIE